MRTLAAPVLAALAGGSVAVVQLIRMQFSGGDVLLNTSTMNLVWDGLTYLGAAGLGTVTPITDGPGEVQGLTMTLEGASSANIGLALGTTVQGAIVTIRTAVIETVNYTILDAPIDWLGAADTMSISEEGDTCTVTLTVESKAVELITSNPLTYSDSDQRTLYAGDLAFQYSIDQVDKPLVWPTKEFFYK